MQERQPGGTEPARGESSTAATVGRMALPDTMSAIEGLSKGIRPSPQAMKVIEDLVKANQPSEEMLKAIEAIKKSAQASESMMMALANTARLALLTQPLDDTVKRLTERSDALGETLGSDVTTIEQSLHAGAVIVDGSPQWEMVTLLAKVHQSLKALNDTVLDAAQVTQVQLGVAQASQERLTELVAVLRAGHESQDRATQTLNRLTRWLLLLTFILAIPLVVDCAGWVWNEVLPSLNLDLR